MADVSAATDAAGSRRALDFPQGEWLLRHPGSKCPQLFKFASHRGDVDLGLREYRSCNRLGFTVLSANAIIDRRVA